MSDGRSTKTCEKCGEVIPVGPGCIHICFEVTEILVFHGGPREINLDNHRHIEGGSCCNYRRCRKCGSGRLHVQETDRGLDTACESCQLVFSPKWQPGGTYAYLEVH